jgi:PPOX class probable F420-dependent enzyme
MLPPVIEPGPDVRERLEASLIIWLTTVAPDGQPQTSPVWYVWQDGRFLIYSLPASPRVRNLRANRRVALNLDGDGEGGDIVTVEGVATLDDAGPPSTAEPAYQTKYLPLITSNGWTPVSFARDYPQRIVVTPTRLRTY